MGQDIRCVIFDFAGTLSPTPYFWPLGQDFCAAVTEAIFTGENKRRWAGPWCRGELSSEDIAEYLSLLTGLTPDEILAALRNGCSEMQLNPSVWRFAQEQSKLGRRTALVTINMDVFSRVVVPSHGFDRVFDIIVSSADYGVDSKIDLCEIVLMELDGCTFENTLLVDDKKKYVDDFRARGGMAYHYTTDDAFAEWKDSNKWQQN